MKRSDGRVACLLRLRPEIKLALQAMAKESQRSLNAEMCIALERHVKAEEDWRR